VFDLPDPPGAAGEQRELVARLRAVIGAKDAENILICACQAISPSRRLRIQIGGSRANGCRGSATQSNDVA
jgi:hypothetical protein